MGFVGQARRGFAGRKDIVPRIAQGTDRLERDVFVGQEPHQSAPGRIGSKV
jgi:hypothetical protein